MGMTRDRQQPDGYTRCLEQRLDLVLFDLGGLVHAPSSAALLVRAAIGLPDRSRAEAVVAAAESLASEWPHEPRLVAASEHARGLRP